MRVLYSGEKIRTPLYSITYFDGDAEYGHNLFRKTVLKHYTPDDGTENVCKLPVAVTTESYGENAIITDVSKWIDKLKLDTVHLQYANGKLTANTIGTTVYMFTAK